jgi:Domain of unknown function (DUF4838)/Glycosyl hydrolase family 67 N-terminus
MPRPQTPPAPPGPAPCGGGVHVLSADGISDWRIVIGASATEPERHAAAELRRYLAEIGGAQLPITDDSSPRRPSEIWVGRSTRWPATEAGLGDGPEDETFLIRTGADHLLVAGAGRRGTLYGVYAFLEKYLGCRWFTPEVSRIPARSRIEIGPIDDRQAPALEYRETYSTEALDPDWAARNRSNGNFPAFSARHGGGVRYAGPFVHSFNELVPVERYFDTHPEYFSEVGGVRLRKDTQLCLSNPEVFALALDKVRSWLRADPHARIVSVSQNDWENPCQCPACRAVDAEEGNYSGSLIRFVNRIAEAIEPEHRHAAVDTLAYQYTRKAPLRVRPRHNVIVRLCSIECCFSHPLESCGEKMLLKRSGGTGATFVEDLVAWGRICGRLYIWDYVTNFANYVLPFPNFDVLAANIRLFVRNNVKGVFALGACMPGGGGEFSALRGWLLARLMWDPAADEGALLRDFLDGVYGRGSGHLLRYIEAQVQLVSSQGLHASIYDRPDSAYLTPGLLALADECFDQAERLADDQAVLARVRKERLAIRFARLAVLPLDAPGRDARIDEFAADARAAGITQVSEHIPLERTIAYLRRGIHLTHFARYEGGWSPLDNPWPIDRQESTDP